MKDPVGKFYTFLQRPLYPVTRLVLAVLVIPLVLVFTQPLWRISMKAPQYPKGLSMDIYAHKVEGGHGGKDIKEINTLNHYIGMKPIAQADFLEMKVIPFAIGVFALFALRTVAVGRIMNIVDLGVLFLYFGMFSLGSFAYRLYSYGHQLDPHAPMKIKPFMPVVFGSQQIANFVQTSLPLAGTYCMGAFFLFVLLALWHSVRQAKRDLQ
jgi:copper chaperone NosL